MTPKFIIALVLALLLGSIGSIAMAAPPTQGFRTQEIGGFGIVLYDTTTFEYGSLDSVRGGSAKAGELVYLNGWQIGVYHVGEKRWIDQNAVVPIFNVQGRPMASVAQAGASGARIFNAPGGGASIGNYAAGTLFPVIRTSGNWYQISANRWVSTSDGTVLSESAARAKLPPRWVSEADRFLAQSRASATVVFTGTSVPLNYTGDIVDPNTISYSSGKPFMATLRVTGEYDWIVLRDAPNFEAKEVGQLDGNAIFHAYEVQGDWYRVNDNQWAPRYWRGQTLVYPENVEGYATSEYWNGGKWISIDLDRQQLTAWEGKEAVVSTSVKTGKYGYYTPAGVWKTYQKVPSARMSGNDYDLLDVAWTQYFTPSRIAIHAAYWHNNYNGRPGSHGCVNTPVEMAEQLFHWAPLGTTVVTHNPYVFDAEDIANASKWRNFERGP